jgi:hypothetical protein
MNKSNIKQISNIENLIEESKIFLNQLNQQVTPYGIVIYTIDLEGKNNHTILYKRDNYIFIITEESQKRTFMYGNWEEALYASKRLLMTVLALQKDPKVSIGQYSK